MREADDWRQRANLLLTSVNSLLLLVVVIMLAITGPLMFEAAIELRKDRQAWHEHDILMQAARQRTLNLQMELQVQQEENLRLAKEIAKTQAVYHKGE